MSTAQSNAKSGNKCLPASAVRFTAVFAMLAPVSFVLVMSWFGTYTFMNAYYIRELGRSNAQWTALTLWFNGTMMLWPFACVPMVVRLGHRGLVAAAIALTGALYAVAGFVETTAAMSVVMVLMAFVPSAISVAWTPVVVEAGGARPGRAVAAYMAVNTLVGAAALTGGGRMLEMVGCRVMFLIVTIVCGVCLAVFWSSSRKLPAPAPAKKVALLSIPKDEYLRLARAPFVFLMLAGISMEPFNFHTANQLFPNLARDAHALSESAIGTIVALGRIPALLSLLMLSRIVDRVCVTRFYGTGLLVGGLCVAGLGAAPSAPSLVALYCGYFMFQGMVWGTNVAAVNAAVDPKEREYAFAVMMSLSTGATFAVGIVHNRLLSSGMVLTNVVQLSGLMGAAAGTLMMAYSFTRFADWSRRTS